MLSLSMAITKDSTFIAPLSVNLHIYSLFYNARHILFFTVVYHYQIDAGRISADVNRVNMVADRQALQYLATRIADSNAVNAGIIKFERENAVSRVGVQAYMQHITIVNPCCA